MAPKIAAYIKLVIIGVVALSFNAVNAEAATRWVVASGGVASGTCSTTGTACTYAYAESVAVAGDTMKFRDGSYGPIQTTKDGITYEAENRWLAILEQPASFTRGTWIRHNDTTIRKFDVDGNNNGRDGLIAVIKSGTITASTPVLTNILIEDNYLHDSGEGGFYIFGVNGIIVRYNLVDDTGNVGEGECFYLSTGTSTFSTSGQVQNLEAYGNTCRDGNNNYVDYKAYTKSANFHHNLFETLNLRSVKVNPPDQGADDGLIRTGAGTTNDVAGNQFDDNIVRNSTTGTASGNGVIRFASNRVDVDSNVFYSNGGAPYFISDDTGWHSSVITNNTSCSSPSTTESTPPGSYTGNLFGQAQSVCDDEVTRIIGEIAAAPTISSCEIGLVSDTIIECTWVNDKFPPLLSVDNADISVTVAGVARTVNSSEIVGSNLTQHTLASAVTNGQAVLISGAAGAVINSGQVGATWIYDLASSAAFTNTSVTNNVGGAAPSYAFAQSHFRFHHLRGTLASPEVIAAEDTSISVPKGAIFRLRTKITCNTADCPAVNLQLRYSKNGGSYTVIPTTFDADNIQMYGTAVTSTDIPSDGAAISSELLTSDESTDVNATLVRAAAAYPNWDCSQDCEGEFEHIIQIDTDATVGDTYDFRMYLDDGNALDSYTTTPRLTVTDYIGGGGF